MKNLVFPQNGGKIHKFSSEYHHESNCKNLMNRDPTLVWFTSVFEPLPQWVIFEFDKARDLTRVGIFIHGENNQNPADLLIFVSEDGKKFKKVVESAIEHKAGDYLYDISEKKVRYVKYMVTKNYGGSGIHISKVFAFGS